MSTEQRVVRPYRGLDALETMFEQVRLRVGNDVVEPGRSVLVPSEEFLATKIVVEFAPSDETWELTREALPARARDVGVAAKDLVVVVIASTSFLKMSDVLLACPVTELDGLQRVVHLTTPPRPRVLQATHHGATIQVLLCLAADIEVRPLRPHRSGTWIARAEFRLSTDFDAIGFRPLPLTADVKREKHIPLATVRYIDVLGTPFDDVRADDAVELWVDADLLARLSLNSRSAASRAFQIQLFVDAVAAIAERARREIAPEWDVADLEETFVGRMLAALAGPGGPSDVLLELMLQSPGKFMAFVEARCGLGKELTKMLGDDDG